MNLRPAQMTLGFPKRQHAYVQPYLPRLLCSIPGRLRSNQRNECDGGSLSVNK